MGKAQKRPWKEIELDPKDAKKAGRSHIAMTWRPIPASEDRWAYMDRMLGDGVMVVRRLMAVVDDLEAKLAVARLPAPLLEKGERT